MLPLGDTVQKAYQSSPDYFLQLYDNRQLFQNEVKAIVNIIKYITFYSLHLKLIFKYCKG